MSALVPLASSKWSSPSTAGTSRMRLPGAVGPDAAVRGVVLHDQPAAPYGAMPEAARTTDPSANRSGVTASSSTLMCSIVAG